MEIKLNHFSRECSGPGRFTNRNYQQENEDREKFDNTTLNPLFQYFVPVIIVFVIPNR